MDERNLPGPSGAAVALDDAVAAITGASSGIGEATAEAMRARGARVVVAARRADRVREIAARVDGLAGTCDVSDYRQVRGPVERAGNWGGRLAVMVNNAGFGVIGLRPELDAERAERMVPTNALGLR